MAGPKPQKDALIRVALLIALLLVAACSDTPEYDPNAFTFTFEPPTGTPWVETTAVERVTRIEGGGSHTERSRQRTEIVVERTAEGYAFASKLLASERVRDGSSARDLLGETMIGEVVTLRADDQARVLGMSGVDQVAGKIARMLPASMAKKLAPLVGAEALGVRIRAEWDARYAGFVGLHGKIGDGFWSESTTTLLDGTSVTFNVHTTFAELWPCPPGACVRVEQVFDSDAVALSELVKETMGTSGTPGPVPTALGREATDAVIRGTVSRLVDPATMMIYDEVVSRTIEMAIDAGDGRRQPAKVEEKRHYKILAGDASR